MTVTIRNQTELARDLGTSTTIIAKLEKAGVIRALTPPGYRARRYYVLEAVRQRLHEYGLNGAPGKTVETAVEFA
jgi:hypothetical protein